MLRALALVLCLLFMLSSANVSMHNPFYCYSEDPIKPQMGMFSTRTAYEINRGRNVDPNVSTCNPSKFWLLSRHGTRLPSVRDLGMIFEYSERLHRDVVMNNENGRTSLCASDSHLINQWMFDPNITLEMEQLLTTSGWNELQGMAQRYQLSFPTLLPSTYSPTDYYFRTTDTQRTIASLQAFADGLFGVNGHEQVEYEDIPERDYLLRPNNYCELYNNVTEIHVEQNEFLEGPEYQEMLTQVSRKLGFHGSHALRAIEVQTLATICKFEQIWDLNSTSPMCAAFSVANHQVLEYFEDLDYYYRTGYGYTNYRQLFENLNCHLLQDLLAHLQSNDVNVPKAKIFNTHLVVLQLIYVAFGAFEEPIPLTRHNFAQQTFRQFKSSVLVPMAANIAIIRYE